MRVDPSVGKTLDALARKFLCSNWNFGDTCCVFYKKRKGRRGRRKVCFKFSQHKGITLKVGMKPDRKVRIVIGRESLPLLAVHTHIMEDVDADDISPSNLKFRVMAINTTTIPLALDPATKPSRIPHINGQP